MVNPKWLVAALEAHHYDLDVVAAAAGWRVQTLFDVIQEHEEIPADVKESVEKSYAAKLKSEEPKPAPRREAIFSRRNPQVIKVAAFVDRRLWQWVQDYSARNGVPLSGIVNEALAEYRQRVA